MSPVLKGTIGGEGGSNISPPLVAPETHRWSSQGEMQGSRAGEHRAVSQEASPHATLPEERVLRLQPP